MKTCWRLGLRQGPPKYFCSVSIHTFFVVAMALACLLITETSLWLDCMSRGLSTVKNNNNNIVNREMMLCVLSATAGDNGLITSQVLIEELQ